MAANRICKVLKVNQDNERLMEEYERLASDVSTSNTVPSLPACAILHTYIILFVTGKDDH